MSYWLRTGMMVPADVLERKFNPNHDPKNGQFTSGVGGRATPRNNSKPVHGQRDSMPLAPTLARDLGLHSPISKDLYENYILGGGDYVLDKATFERAARYVEMNPKNVGGAIVVKFADGTTGLAKTVSFYHDPEFALAFGSATVYYQNGTAVGFYDKYDFDSKPLDQRSILNEAKTRLAGKVGLGGVTKVFDIHYGKSQKKKGFVRNFLHCIRRCGRYVGLSI